MADLDKDDIEALRIVAQSDLSASWIAKELLQSVEGDTSYSTENPTEPSTEADNEAQNPKESIFAY